MKLRNKKTGEIKDTKELIIPEWFKKDWKYLYKKLKWLLNDWEDYEEPKEHYFITEYGEVYSLNEYEGLNNVANPEDYKSIGNYFETREEAEKAVEKLKAWKRLKDKGFRFEGIKEMYIGNAMSFRRDGTRYLHFNKSEDDKWMKENWKDLVLLFGGVKNERKYNFSE